MQPTYVPVHQVNRIEENREGKNIRSQDGGTHESIYRHEART